MPKQRINKGGILLIIFSVLPIIYRLFIPKIDPIFANFQNFIIALGEIFGLVGMLTFSLNLIITTRLPFIEKLFNGLNNAYKKHNILGQIAFILLLFHPLLLLPRYASSFQEAAKFLFIGDSLAINLGIIALATVIILIVLTLFLRPKYNIWKITHKFFGAVLFLGALHVYLIPSYIMTNFLLKIYVLAFALLGIIAFIYRSLLTKIFVKKYTYIVKEIKQLNHEIIEISLISQKNKIKFKPGQFIFIQFLQKGLSKESHPFSISSSPHEELLKITIKTLGDYTSELFNKLKIGTKAKIEGAFGTFSYNQYNNKNQIWIAGGVGITPFISFIKDIEHTAGYNIKLFYCVKSQEEVIYSDLLQQYERNSNNKFQLIPFFSEEKGHINKEAIIKEIPDINAYDFFLCAPPKMIQELKKEIITLNIQPDRIHSEEFNF